MSATTNARADRVVVVDDDARIRDLLRRYLAQEGITELDAVVMKDGLVRAQTLPLGGRLPAVFSWLAA